MADLAKKILVVEDDPLLRSLYLRCLEQDGFEVLVAEDGLEGLELVKQQPDLILLDLMMPQVDGQEFLRRYNALENKPDIPIIVLSNLDLDDIVQTALKQGAIDYLIKVNIGPKTLLNKIKKYL